MSEIEGFDLQPIRNTAWLGWPVEWLDRYRPFPEVDSPHVTCLYFRDIEGVDKEEFMAEATSYLDYVREYRVVKVTGVDAFGPEFDHPALTVDAYTKSDYSVALIEERKKLAKSLESYGWDNSFPFRPHITVNLKTLIKPPTRVLLRPLELWWKDDEPVKL